MSSNQDKIMNHYNGGVEDYRFEKSKSTGLEFHYTKKFISQYIKPESRIIELGCGTGYYGMHFADKCAEYVGIDITLENIQLFNQKIKDSKVNTIHAEVGDATDLKNIIDQSFDLVLCLGPMYHLPPEERELVFKECKRISRDNAVILFAYINRIGVYTGACVSDKWRNIYPNPKTNQYVFEYSTDDEKPGLFYFTSPEEMEDSAKRNGLETVHNHGLDFFFASSAIDMMNDTQFECYLELADKMSESRSCTGLSNHALLICKKVI